MLVPATGAKQKEKSKMNKRNMILTAILGVITLAAVPFVYAQHQGMHGGMHGMHGGMHAGGFGMFSPEHLAHAKEALGLSDAQVDQLKAIAKDFHAQNAQYHQQLHGGLLQVAQTLINDPNNIAGAQALLDQQNATEATLKTNALQAASKALNVLTPEQRAKVGDFLAKRAAMHNQQ
jgi:Spy/CpxP family protein refolding chaperone